MELKEKEKTEKYQDLARELRKTRGVLIVIGARGTIPKELVGHSLRSRRLEVVSPSRAPLFSCAQYFQVPATPVSWPS